MIKVFEKIFESNFENYIQEAFCLDNFSVFSVKIDSARESGRKKDE